MLFDDGKMEGEYEGAMRTTGGLQFSRRWLALPTTASRTTAAMDGCSQEWEGQRWERGEGMENVGECPGAVYIDGGGREGSDRRG
jgi:hypothetical protein